MTAKSKLVYTCAIALGASVWSANISQAASLFDFWRSDPAINQVDDLTDYGADPAQAVAQSHAPAQVQPSTQSRASALITTAPSPANNRTQSWQARGFSAGDDGLGDYDEDFRNPSAVAASSRAIRPSVAPVTHSEQMAAETDLSRLWRAGDLARNDGLGDYGEDHRGNKVNADATSFAGLPAEPRVSAEEMRAFMRNEVTDTRQRQAQHYDWRGSTVGDGLGTYGEDHNG